MYAQRCVICTLQDESARLLQQRWPFQRVANVVHGTIAGTYGKCNNGKHILQHAMCVCGLCGIFSAQKLYPVSITFNNQEVTLLLFVVVVVLCVKCNRRNCSARLLVAVVIKYHSFTV